MAKWYAPVVIMGIFLLVGCAPQQSSSVVDSLPGPSFTGPTLIDRLDAPPPTAAGPAVSQNRSVAVSAAPLHPAAITASHKGRLGDIPPAWIPASHVTPGQWQYIVIHHSATATGGASAFDKMHKAKGWDELGYHFVVGNGTDTRDGQIEVGSRWPKQKWGAHTKTPNNEFNEHGIGICMVGNFDVSHPTDAQLKSIAHLVSYLMKTYHIPADHVLGHRDCKSTDCPGKFVNILTLRRLSTQMLAAAGEPIPQDLAPAALASGELLHDTGEPTTAAR